MTAGSTTPSSLELRGVSRRFGSVTALDAVDLVVHPRTVHAVLGENGAGKSTLMRIAFGLLPADAGDVRLFGASVGRLTVREAMRLGVGMVQQHPALVGNLTAAENVVLGGRGLFRPAEANTRLREAMTKSGLRIAESQCVRDLDIVDQQRLEILKALSHRARLLILDEPTAVLAPGDSQALLRWVREFADSGASVVLVTHKLREALSVADHVTVLRRGRVTLTGRATGASADALAAAMFPDAAPLAITSASLAPPGDVVVSASGVSIDDRRGAVRIRDASFEVRRHEIVGVAAVEGAGHRELLLAMAGLLGVSRGTVRIPERSALIPADRAREALIPEFTLTENVALRDLGRRRGALPWREMAAKTKTLMDRFAIKASSVHARAKALSGGNQQRLVIGRELDGEVDLVVADNPTRGLDLHASAFVYEQLRAAAKRAAVVVHTPDVDEMLLLASRVLVVFNGSVREVGLDREVIGRAMIGADAGAAA